MKSQKPEHIIIYDLETAGLDMNKHAITQIAAVAVRLEDLEIVNEFEAKILFDISNAEKSALAVNSFNSETWAKEAKKPSTVAVEFDSFCSPYQYTFVSQKGNRVSTGFGCGHNSERFDCPFLHAWYKRLGVWCPMGFKGLDTMQMALTLEMTHEDINFKGDHKLANVATVLGIDFNPDDLHDALDDVKLTAKVFKELFRRLGGKQ